MTHMPCGKGHATFLTRLLQASVIAKISVTSPSVINMPLLAGETKYVGV